jgi:mRNA-degrading endonuclease RelE of RelBE toxin-antitoxin system
MNFLRKIISKTILKSLEKLSKEDPEIRAQLEAFAEVSQELAKTIHDFNKKREKSDDLRNKRLMDF